MSNISAFAIISTITYSFLLCKQAKLGKSASIGQGKAFKNKWINKKPPNYLVRIVDSIVDQTKIDLQQLQSTGTLPDAKLLADYKKRKLADKQ